MTDKEFKRLRRSELLEMLFSLSKENEQLKEEIAAGQEELRKRAIVMEKTGSLAEASLALNGVFAAADEAVAQYVESIQEMFAHQEALCAQMEAETREKCQAMLRETEEQCKAERERPARQQDGSASDMGASS